MIDAARGANPLRDVAPPVVGLQEKPAGVAGQRWQPAVPHVGDEHRDVAAASRQRNHAAAIARQLDIPDSIFRRPLARLVTARNHAGRAAFERAVLQIDVCADSEHRIRNPIVPGNARRPRDVRPGIDVPRAAAVGIALARRIAPARVRNHVAVFAEQRLDRLEDRCIGNRRLTQRAAIEHLVAKIVVLFDGTLRVPPVRRQRRIQRNDLGGQRCDLSGADHTAQHGEAFLLQLPARVRRGAFARQQIASTSRQHD